MQSQRLEDLFFRYCEKNITGEEKEELMNLLLLDQNREQINGLIDRLIRNDKSEHYLSPEIADDILTSIFTATARKAEPEFVSDPVLINNQKPTGKSQFFWMIRLAAASLALLMVYGGYRWLNTKKQKPVQTAVLQSVFGEDVVAGGNKASLTLETGQTFDLSTVQSGNLKDQPGVTVDKSKGEITYSQLADAQALSHNVLRTPLGGQYKIVLPDGSRAWLNAGSSLKYPTTFTGTERHVEMTGEIYFEIEPDKQMPFHVQVTDKVRNGRDMEIMVLGTHFNICSYGDEPTMQTTLLEGSVKVKKGNVSRILSPGQQAEVPAGEQERKIAIKTVDTESVIAWKEGRFEFNGNIKEIMRQISRWYDLDVHYEGNVGRKAFAGTISRKNNVSEVLKMLELTGGIQFRIEDRKITVKSTD